MSGFEIVGPKMVITQGARTAFTTDGTLINLLPPANDLSPGPVDLTWPSFSKDCAYFYQGFNDGTTTAEFAESFVSIPPQEWAGSIDLGAVPAAQVDFMDVQINMTRIVNPSVMYAAQVPKVLPEGVWMDMSGSAIVEMAFGMARTFDVQMSSGRVIATLRQSFMAAPNWWLVRDGGDIRDGGYGWSFNGQRGMPVQSIASFGPQNVNSRSRMRLGSNHLPYDNGSDFTSIWRTYFKIAFGRRS